MSKKIKDMLKNESRQLIDIQDNFGEVKNKIKMQKNYEDKNYVIFNKKSFLLFSSLVTLLICIVSSFTTYYVVSQNEENKFHEVIVDNNKNVEIAIEQIKNVCDSYEEYPISSFYVDDGVCVNIYSGIKYSDQIENLYFLQVCYLLNKEFNITIEFMNMDNIKNSFTEPNDLYVYQINDSYDTTSQLKMKVYSYNREIFNAILFF